MTVTLADRGACGEVAFDPAAAPDPRVVVGPDVQRLRRSYPARPRELTWPTTQLPAEAVLARLLSAPFAADIADSRDRLRRRQGRLQRVLGWLADEPGDTWQASWLASGADSMGNADWVRLVLTARPGHRGCDGVGVTSGLRACAPILISTDVIRPSLGWVLTPRARTPWCR